MCEELVVELGRKPRQLWLTFSVFCFRFASLAFVVYINQLSVIIRLNFGELFFHVAWDYVTISIGQVLLRHKMNRRVFQSSIACDIQNEEYGIPVFYAWTVCQISRIHVWFYLSFLPCQIPFRSLFYYSRSLPYKYSKFIYIYGLYNKALAAVKCISKIFFSCQTKPLLDVSVGNIFLCSLRWR